MKLAKEMGTVLGNKFIRPNIVISDFSHVAQRVLKIGIAQGKRKAFWTDTLHKGIEARRCETYSSGSVTKTRWWSDNGDYFTFDEDIARHNSDYVVVLLR